MIRWKAYLAALDDRLITHLILQDPFRRCATRTVRETADVYGLWSAASRTRPVIMSSGSPLTVSVVCGISRPPQVEGKISKAALEFSSGQAVNPKADLLGSAKNINAISPEFLVSDPLTDRRANGEE